MTLFVLQPCKLREDRFVPQKDEEPLVIKSIQGLLDKFAPTMYGHRVQLRQLRVGAYVGLIKGSRSRKTVPFLVWNPDRSNRIRWLINQDPEFGDRVLEVYRADTVDWGASVSEVETGKKDIPTWKSKKNVRMMEV